MIGCARYPITPGIPAQAQASDIVPELIKAAQAGRSEFRSTTLILSAIFSGFEPSIQPGYEYRRLRQEVNHLHFFFGVKDFECVQKTGQNA